MLKQSGIQCHQPTPEMLCPSHLYCSIVIKENILHHSFIRRGDETENWNTFWSIPSMVFILLQPLPPRVFLVTVLSKTNPTQI